MCFKMLFIHIFSCIDSAWYSWMVFNIHSVNQQLLSTNSFWLFTYLRRILFSYFLGSVLPPWLTLSFLLSHFNNKIAHQRQLAKKCVTLAGAVRWRQANLYNSNGPVVCATTGKISVAKCFWQPAYHIQKSFGINSTISMISRKREANLAGLKDNYQTN